MNRVTQAVAHEGFLSHRGFRYFKWALVLCIGSIVAYRLDDPVAGPSGGTWVGYGLGGIAALLVLWLAWLGVRRRRYGSGAGSVRGWTSAHVYLGLSLIVVATLHCAFEFGRNIHTLAYALMMVVIVSGIYGIVAYARYPSLISANRGGARQDLWLTELDELDEQSLRLAAAVDADSHQRISVSIDATRLGGTLRHRLFGPVTPESGPGTPLMRLSAQLAAGRLYGEDSQRVRQLIDLLARRDSLIMRINRDLRFHARMRVWLLLHVPMTFALIAALIAHVVSVFVYW